MNGYSIIGIFWKDHVTFLSQELPENPDAAIDSPTLTVGILLAETDKTYLIAHDIERYDDRDEGTFSVIYKNAVIAKQVFGSIELENIRFKGV